MPLTLDQAEALYLLIAADRADDDEATLTRINSTPAVETFPVSELTLQANPAIGPLKTASLKRALRDAAATLAASDQPELLDQSEMLAGFVRRLESPTGLDLAQPTALPQLAQLEATMPGPVAELAPLIRAMIPTQARTILGRNATAEDLDDAREVAKARANYEQIVSAAHTVYARIVARVAGEADA